MVVDLKQLISDIVFDTDDKMHKQCKFCGKFFTPTEKNKIYCSEECRKKARNKKIRDMPSDKKE